VAWSETLVGQFSRPVRCTGRSH